MKNITVSIDEETHRQARIRAAELGTSVSALVRSYLLGLVDGTNRPSSTHDTLEQYEVDRRKEGLKEVIEEINAQHPSFRASDSLSREALYDQARTIPEAPGTFVDPKHDSTGG